MAFLHRGVVRPQVENAIVFSSAESRNAVCSTGDSRHEEVEMSVISLIGMEPGSDWPGHVGDSDNVVAGGFDAGRLVQRTRHMLAAAPGLVMTRGPEHAAGSRALTPAWNRAVPVGGGDSPVPV
jgi:hypothetical protein